MQILPQILPRFKISNTTLLALQCSNAVSSLWTALVEQSIQYFPNLQCPPNHHFRRKIQHFSGKVTKTKSTTQNAPKHAISSEKYNFFLVRGHIPLPRPPPVGKGTPFLRPPLAPTKRLDPPCMPLEFQPLTPVSRQNTSRSVRPFWCSSPQRFPMLFNVPDNPKIVPSPWGSGPPSNTRFLGPTWVSPKRHLDRFSRSCRAHERDQHTDTHRQTDRPRYFVSSNSPHIMQCTQCSLIISKIAFQLHLLPAVLSWTLYYRIHNCTEQKFILK